MRFFLLFLLIPLQVVALSPRLLVTIDPKSPVTARSIAAVLEAHIVPFDELSVLEEHIKKLDKSSDNHRIILEHSPENLSRLARCVGYDFMTVTDRDVESACQSILAREKNIPLTDAHQRRVDAQTAGKLYALMMEVDDFLRHHQLTYWATSGTLLGAIRHQGLIPWDDDLDICMYAHEIPQLLSLQDELAQRGLAIAMHPFGWYKIYFVDGQKIEIIDKHRKAYQYQDYFEWTYPSIDIFVMQLDKENMVSHVSVKAKSIWAGEYFHAYELIPPFTLLPFGPMYIPVPRNTHGILNRMYGQDWNEITYCDYDHQKEDSIQKIKVALVDRSSVPYLLPLAFKNHGLQN